MQAQCIYNVSAVTVMLQCGKQLLTTIVFLVSVYRMAVEVDTSDGKVNQKLMAWKLQQPP